MTNKIKSGQEVLNEFFNEISKIEVLDQEIAKVIVSLYREDKLTNTNLSNELTRIREEKIR